MEQKTNVVSANEFKTRRLRKRVQQASEGARHSGDMADVRKYFDAVRESTADDLARRDK